MEKGVAEKKAWRREKAGDGYGGVELFAGADGGGACALSEKRTETKSERRYGSTLKIRCL